MLRRLLEVSELNTIAQFINPVTDNMLTWANAVWSQGGEYATIYDRFLQKVLDHCPESKQTGERFLTLKQGNLRIAEFALNFRTFTAGSA